MVKDTYSHIGDGETHIQHAYEMVRDTYSVEMHAGDGEGHPATQTGHVDHALDQMGRQRKHLTLVCVACGLGGKYSGLCNLVLCSMQVRC